MKTRLLSLMLAASLTLISCTDDSASEAQKAWEADYTLNFDYGGCNTTPTIIELDSEDWELTGKVLVEDGVYETSEVYDPFYEFIGYDSTDADNIPYPLTDSRLALLYGTVEGSSVEEIVCADALNFTLNKISSTELELYLTTFHYRDRERSYSFELRYGQEYRYITINQNCTMEDMLNIEGFSSTSGSYIYNVNSLLFAPEGGTFTFTKRGYGTHKLPDTVAEGESGFLYLYTDSRFGGNQYDETFYSMFDYYAYYPSSQEAGESMELTYGTIGDSTEEEIVAIESGDHGVSIKKTSDYDFEITLAANTTGVYRRIYFNILSDIGSGETPQGFCITQAAE